MPTNFEQKLKNIIDVSIQSTENDRLSTTGRKTDKNHSILDQKDTLFIDEISPLMLLFDDVQNYDDITWYFINYICKKFNRVGVIFLTRAGFNSYKLEDV